MIFVLAVMIGQLMSCRMMVWKELQRSSHRSQYSLSWCWQRSL